MHTKTLKRPDPKRDPAAAAIVAFCGLIQATEAREIAEAEIAEAHAELEAAGVVVTINRPMRKGGAHE